MKRKEKKAQCQRCGRWFRHLGQYAYYCEPCRPIVKREQTKAWQTANPLRVRKTCRAWRKENNPAWKRAWAEKSRARVNAAARASYWKDPETRREYNKIKQRESRARRKQQGGT